MSDLSALHRKRGSVQAAITNFTKIMDKWVQEPGGGDTDYLQASLESMQQSFDKFNDIQEELEELDESEADKRFELQDKYNRALGRARKLLRERGLTLQNDASRASTPISVTTPIPTSLPQIQLPKFDGSTEGWASFYDIFTSLIHKNESLPPVRKLQYLRLSLTGRAASAIESLETTDQNYAIAIETLKKKFECTRRTIRRHWTILCEYPRLEKDTPSALHNLVDAFYQHTRALENLKAPVSSWDVPLSELILSKIGQNTAWQWELTLQDDQMPTYNQLLGFLEKRANCSDFTYKGDKTQGSKNAIQRRDDGRNKKGKATQEAPKAQAFATSNYTVSCPICNQEHRIYTCPRFRALSVEQRQRAVTKALLCYNCLGRGHGSKTCKAGPCHTCQKGHHTFLHGSTGQQPSEEPTPSTSRGPQVDSSREA